MVRPASDDYDIHTARADNGPGTHGASTFCSVNYSFDDAGHAEATITIKILELGVNLPR